MHKQINYIFLNILVYFTYFSDSKRISYDFYKLNYFLKTENSKIRNWSFKLSEKDSTNFVRPPLVRASVDRHYTGNMDTAISLKHQAKLIVS
jgi:hypothetical protein